MIMYSSPSSLISLPEYLPNRILIADLARQAAMSFAIFQTFAFADGHDFAFLRLFLGRVRDVQGRLA